MAKVGDTVTVLPSEFDNDHWQGVATVKEISSVNHREHLVDLAGEEIWFDMQRLRFHFEYATCPARSLVYCRPNWCKHCFRNIRLNNQPNRPGLLGKTSFNHR